MDYLGKIIHRYSSDLCGLGVFARDIPTLGCRSIAMSNQSLPAVLTLSPQAAWRTHRQLYYRAYPHPA
jgi:hypothetical protein